MNTQTAMQSLRQKIGEIKSYLRKTEGKDWPESIGQLQELEEQIEEIMQDVKSQEDKLEEYEDKDRW